LPESSAFFTFRRVADGFGDGMQRREPCGGD
jgi:hypothetical protein